MTPEEVIAATLVVVEAMIAEVMSVLLPSIVLLIEILGRIEECRTIREYRTLGHETRLERLNQFINHSDVTCIDQLRVDRRSFGILCELLRTVGNLREKRSVGVEEQVAMFLHVLAHHESCDQVQFCSFGSNNE
ncbi:hypothetical protein Cni_G20134 [Canna indica]|uniref:DUF8040 domain-containing protein n=1 Tax=Canna indica TaxID=4628 RepID=A0AAQ3KSW1_9LILI|nr:hypothetical protein Cni_G20134 [Canna indica]